MATNKYNRGMPIIKRHKPVEPVTDEHAEVNVEQVESVVIPINFRRQSSIVRNPARVRATRLITHTFFWDVA